jgi:hypothetical protein
MPNKKGDVDLSNPENALKRMFPELNSMVAFGPSGQLPGFAQKQFSKVFNGGITTKEGDLTPIQKHLRFVKGRKNG